MVSNAIIKPSKIIRKSVAEYRPTIMLCNWCADCVARCPVYAEEGWESVTPRGKLLMLKGQLKEWHPMTEGAIKRLYACTSCKLCSEICPTGFIDPPEIIRVARSELVKAGKAPLPEHRKMDSVLQQSRNPYGKPQSERFGWLPKEFPIKGKGENAYFAGCVSSYRYPSVAEATVRVLNKSGFDFAVLRDEWCCGNHPYWDGNQSTYEEFARHNAELLKDSGVKKVITGCAGCYTMLKNTYPQTIPGFSIEVQHITEVLDKLLNDGKLKFVKNLPMKTTYHDPCHLGRHGEVYEPPRRVLSRIPGVSLVEMQYNRKNSNCCGGGGGFFTVYPEEAVNIALKRIKEARQTGAESVVSACPLCETNLRYAAARLEEGAFPVHDLVSLVAKSMGLPVKAEAEE
ncbi:MAG: (Fe-S)-binding protein [Promethearchaeati archaeon SRVP18_Atabeyarchaeia-1]